MQPVIDFIYYFKHERFIYDQDFEHPFVAFQSRQSRRDW